MKDYKKKVLMIIGFILVFIVFLVLILDHYLKDEEKKKPTPNTSEEVFRTDISALTDYNEFFTVNQIVNQYFLALAGSDKELVYSFLDDDYITSSQITIANLDSKLNHNYHNVSYTAMEIYYNADSVVTYYFVNGFLEDVDLSDDSSLYYKDLKCLVIVDKNKNTFTITPIETSESMATYAARYPLKEKELKNNLYHLYSTTEERALQTYLSTFQSLLFLDSEKAYSMIYDETKRKYLDYADFENQIPDIYEEISTKIFSYAKVEGTPTIYRIIDENERRFTIYESKVMDFKISY